MTEHSNSNSLSNPNNNNNSIHDNDKDSSRRASNSSDTVSQRTGSSLGSADGLNSPSTNTNRLLKSDVSPTSMIFRNLLILEDDLRKQYKQQLLVRYVFSLFVIVLVVLLSVLLYEYQYVKYLLGQVAAQFLLWFLLITLMLFHLSGEYRRTIALPRKFFQLTNRGLKQFNCKLIQPENKFNIINIIGVNILFELLLDFLIKTNIKLCGLLSRTTTSATNTNTNTTTTTNGGALDEGKINFFEYKLTYYKILKQTNINNDNEDIKIILNPKIFNSNIREGWEIYRDEFWSRERQRRLNKLDVLYER